MTDQARDSKKSKAVAVLVALVVALNFALWMWKSQNAPPPLPSETDRMSRQKEMLLAGVQK